MSAVSIIIAIFIFALIILIHEIGHFTAARLFKMRVYSFSIGMGPVLLRKRGKETDYCIKAIPFGGSVQLGEDMEDDGTGSDPNSFRNKPVWQRMIVMLAGAFMNVVLGFVLCVIIVAISNSVQTSLVNVSYNEYLKSGDRITHINGMRVFTVADINYQLYNTESKLTDDENTAAFDFTVVRNGEKVHLPNVAFNAVTMENGGKQMALDFNILYVKKNIGNVIAGGAKQTLSYSRLIVITLIDLIRGTYGINDIAGPVGVVNVIGEATNVGFAESILAGIRNALYMAAIMTINVGIFNLLPVPALDGSRFLFFVVEAVRRKPVKPEVEGMIHFVGLAALMLFMVLVTVLDIRRIFTG